MPFSSPGDLPDPGIEFESLMPLALASGFSFLSFFFKPVSHLGSLIPKEGRGVHPVGGKEQVLPGESACAKALR